MYVVLSHVSQINRVSVVIVSCELFDFQEVQHGGKHASNRDLVSLKLALQHGSKVVARRLSIMRPLVGLFTAALLARTPCWALLSSRPSFQKMHRVRRHESPSACFLSSIDTPEISQALSNILDSLPAPLAENPTLTITGAAITLVAGLFSIILPPSRVLSNAAIQSILEETYIGEQLKRRPSVALQCVYKASRDGWSATDFHEKVDTLGSGIVAAKTAFGGTVLGGFNPNGWRSTDDYTTSTTAFLFYKARNGQIVKYPVVAGSPAIFDYATSGPCFGATDLIIGPPQAAILGGFTGPDLEDDSLAAGSLKRARILPGQAYDTNKQWPLRGFNVPLQEVEVYCLVD